MSIVFGADGLGSMRSKCVIFPEDQIQLMGLRPAYLTIFRISKPNGKSGVKKKVCVAFCRNQSPPRHAKWKSQFEFVQLGNSVPREDGTHH